MAHCPGSSRLESPASLSPLTPSLPSSPPYLPTLHPSLATLYVPLFTFLYFPTPPFPLFTFLSTSCWIFILFFFLPFLSLVTEQQLWDINLLSSIPLNNLSPHPLLPLYFWKWSRNVSKYFEQNIYIFFNIFENILYTYYIRWNTFFRMYFNTF